MPKRAYSSLCSIVIPLQMTIRRELLVQRSGERVHQHLVECFRLDLAGRIIRLFESSGCSHHETGRIAMREEEEDEEDVEECPVSC